MTPSIPFRTHPGRARRPAALAWRRPAAIVAVVLAAASISARIERERVESTAPIAIGQVSLP